MNQRTRRFKGHWAAADTLTPHQALYREVGGAAHATPTLGSRHCVLHRHSRHAPCLSRTGRHGDGRGTRGRQRRGAWAIHNHTGTWRCPCGGCIHSTKRYSGRICVPSASPREGGGRGAYGRRYHLCCHGLLCICRRLCRRKRIHNATGQHHGYRAGCGRLDDAGCAGVHRRRAIE